MEKSAFYFHEDTPENRELMNKAFEEHMRVFGNSPLYYTFTAKKDNNELKIH